MVVALRSPAAHDGCRSYSSGRAVQTRSKARRAPNPRGTRRRRAAPRPPNGRPRRRERKARFRIASRRRLQAVNDSSLEAETPESTPSKGRTLARSHSVLRHPRVERRRAFALLRPANRTRRCPSSALTSRPRPKRDSVAIRKAAALPPGDEIRELVDVGEQLSDQSALPETGLADNGHELRRALSNGLVEVTAQSGDRSLCPRADLPSSGSRPSRSAHAPVARHNSSGADFPFAVTGSRGSYSNTSFVARMCPRRRPPRSRAPPFDASRRLTASPRTAASPLSGDASRVTITSPVFTPMRTLRSTYPHGGHTARAVVLGSGGMARHRSPAGKVCRTVTPSGARVLPPTGGAEPTSIPSEKVSPLAELVARPVDL